MLEPNFERPDTRISREETQKRLLLLAWFTEYIQPAVTGLLVTGSMAYGQNYSVKPTSDIDMQLLVTPETVKELMKTNCFDSNRLQKAVTGYAEGHYQQFSLVFHKDNVPMECHFWDEQAYIAAVTFDAENTKRLRASIDIPSRDYAYSFDREENIKDYYGEMFDGYAVVDFPSYRRINGKLFLCRPITNMLGCPLVKITNAKLTEAMDTCWGKTVNELVAYADKADRGIDLDRISIVNTLPGKNKMAPDILQEVQDKTKRLIKELDQALVSEREL